MNRIKNLVIFYVLPLLIIVLLILNAKIASRKYNLESNIKKNEYSAEIQCDLSNLTLNSSEETIVTVNVVNRGIIDWISEGENRIDLSYHILNKWNKSILEGDRVNLTKVIRNGEGASLQLKIKAPNDKGKYKIEIDMVQEGITWFKEKGSEVYNIELTVE